MHRALLVAVLVAACGHGHTNGPATRDVPAAPQSLRLTARLDGCQVVARLENFGPRSIKYPYSCCSGPDHFRLVVDGYVGPLVGPEAYCDMCSSTLRVLDSGQSVEVTSSPPLARRRDPRREWAPAPPSERRTVAVIYAGSVQELDEKASTRSSLTWRREQRVQLKSAPLEIEQSDSGCRPAPTR